MGIGFFGRLNHFLSGRIRPAVKNIIHDSARKEIDVLLHDADIAAQALQRHVPDVLSVDADAA